MKTIIPSEVSIPILHQYLISSVAPRPICFASTINSDGVPNLAPFSFFNVFSANPPVLIFAPNNSGRTGEPKHTFLNVKQVKEVVINIINHDLLEKMNLAAAPWEYGVSEFEKAGFTPIDSTLVKPYRVKECPVQIECEVMEIKELGVGGGAGNLVICKVLAIHVSEDVLNEEGKIDQKKMNLVGRLGGSWYSKADDSALFELKQPMETTIGFDKLPENARNSHVLTANDLGKLATIKEFPSQETVEKIKSMNIQNVHEFAKNCIESGDLDSALAAFIVE
jgi:flavin reductase (DIM6/NTAB) family NADH-FMN oxidoreductase RutF